MSVKLVSYSKPTYEFEEKLKDVQDLIAFCAKVSNPGAQYNMETAEKLISYLMKHAHWSPFEMASACLEITTTRDIARQFLRHRSFSFQEFSQRYADPTDDLSFVLREARLQDHKNRQNSIDLDDTKDSIMLQRQWDQKQKQVIHEAQMAYQWAIDNGLAKEQARSVLPEGNTVSRLYANGTIRSWIHYCDLRTGNGTQKEHMYIARECANAISQIFPYVEKYT